MLSLSIQQYCIQQSWGLCYQQPCQVIEKGENKFLLHLFFVTFSYFYVSRISTSFMNSRLGPREIRLPVGNMYLTGNSSHYLQLADAYHVEKFI